MAGNMVLAFSAFRSELRALVRPNAPKPHRAVKVSLGCKTKQSHISNNHVDWAWRRSREFVHHKTLGSVFLRHKIKTKYHSLSGSSCASIDFLDFQIGNVLVQVLLL